MENAKDWDEKKGNDVCLDWPPSDRDGEIIIARLILNW